MVFDDEWINAQGDLVPRLVIAGTHSGVGKTTIATGIMAALAARGFGVQGFKVGPDYIDPSYHTGATGRVSRNLDFWMLGDRLISLFAAAARGADIAVVEGVMGLFDGIKGQKSRGSTAHVAKLINAPVVLIVDARSSAYSTAALVLGYASFDPDLRIGGVILNRIGSLNHLAMAREAVEDLGIPVMGHLGREETLSLPERHLGLVPLGERGAQGDYFSHLAATIGKNIDVDRLLDLARAGSGNYAGRVGQMQEAKQQMVKAGEQNTGTNAACTTGAGERLDADQIGQGEGASVAYPDALTNRPVRIALARDEAFSFYYQDTLDLMQSMGAEFVPFSPLHDRSLPEGIDGIFIGGGFPETFLEQLEANRELHLSLREAHAKGVPVYAECGGLMYLCRQIVGFDGRSHGGAGLVPAVCAMSSRLQGMGYRRAELLQDCLLGPRGLSVQGHEFHYSSIRYNCASPAYGLLTAAGEDKGEEGYVGPNIVASYLHLNFAGYPRLAENFLKACRQGVRPWASR